MPKENNMSYIVMAFSQKRHFSQYNSFKKWFDEVTWWKEETDYSNLLITTPKLRQWFLAIKDMVPPRREGYSLSSNYNDKEECCAEYYFTKEFIYVICPWNKAKSFSKIAFKKAKELNLAIYSAIDDCVFYPDGSILSPFNQKECNENTEYKETGTIEKQIRKVFYKQLFLLSIILFIIISLCYDLTVSSDHLPLFTYFKGLIAIIAGILTFISTQKDINKTKTYIKEIDDLENPADCM